MVESLLLRLFYLHSIGYIVEYLEGHAIKLEEMSDPYKSKLIAEKIAEWHCSIDPVPQIPLPSKNGLWKVIER